MTKLTLQSAVKSAAKGTLPADAALAAVAAALLAKQGSAAEEDPEAEAEEEEDPDAEEEDPDAEEEDPDAEEEDPDMETCEKCGQKYKKPDEADAELKEYQAEFGRVQGAVYFAEGVSFATATAIKQSTSDLISGHAAELAAQQANLDKLTADLKAASAQLLGEEEPVSSATSEESASLKARAVRMGSEGRARYAEKLELKMQKS